MAGHLRLVHDVPAAALPRLRPLPSAWDGEQVWWNDWIDGATSLDFHLPLEDVACQGCGAIETPLRSVGRYANRLLHYRRLHATRCRSCGHDTVTEWNEDGLGPTWDLDESDYGPDGSWEAGQGTLL